MTHALKVLKSSHPQSRPLTVAAGRRGDTARHKRPDLRREEKDGAKLCLLAQVTEQPGAFAHAVKARIDAGLVPLLKGADADVRRDFSSEVWLWECCIHV